MKKIIILLTILFSLSFAYAQEREQSDFINTIITPSVVILVLIFGVLSVFKLPKFIGGILSLVATAGLFFMGFIESFASLILSFGSLVSTLTYIGLFLIGAMLISRTDNRKTKRDANYYAIRKMNRKQIAQEISNIEKRLVDVNNRLNKLKIQEHNLELRFANEKTPQVVKDLEKIRKLKNELNDLMDTLLENKEMYKRAYREATS